MSDIKVGDRFHAMGCVVTVMGLGRKYADIRVVQLGTWASWTKKQPMPFPDTWERLNSSGGDSDADS